MHKHPYFNLYIHDDQELAVYVGAEIVARETLQEWPLSCVERVTTGQGQWIYKSQFGPTIEAAFYAVARSDLLDRVQTIYQAEGHACTLRDYIDAPLIEDLNLTEEQAAQIVRQVRTQISEIKVDLPGMYDIRTPDRWLALAADTLRDINTLIEQGRYTVATPKVAAGLGQWVQASSTLEAVQRHPGLVHGDFHGDNLFVLPDGGYRLIDWQRPFWGPIELDIAAMMNSLGFDPLNYVSPSIVRIGHFLLIHWFSQCATRWFPEGAETYDRSTAELASKIQSLS